MKALLLSWRSGIYLSACHLMVNQSFAAIANPNSTISPIVKHISKIAIDNVGYGVPIFAGVVAIINVIIGFKETNSRRCAWGAGAAIVPSSLVAIMLTGEGAMLP